VLAGLIGAYWAAGQAPLDAAAEAVYAHGRAADTWPAEQALTASALAQRMRPRDTFTPA
jgi:NAD(P)H-hydrate repair Nnr-like enzyme with NAD(P)H-hydrate dehydratase domain